MSGGLIMENKELLLRVGSTLISTEVNGPGRRLVVWFQGCTFFCDGCFNPEFHDLAGGVFMTGEELLSRALAEGVEGFTFSGGEPFLQAGALARFAARARDAGLGIVCYTGYSFEQLLKNQVAGGAELLEQVDMLIDGLYCETERAALLWRGSRNQQVRFLTSRYRHLEEYALREGVSEVEMIVGDGSFALTGIFPLEFWQRLKDKLEGGLESGGSEVCKPETNKY